MESIDGQDDARVVALAEQHLAGCLALSRSASWNQNEADWRVMLAVGRGWGLTMADGTLAASTVILPYGGKFSWISMVLVLPQHRRKGYASLLLRKALHENARLGLTSILDATPAGREVYVQEGFQDRWSFSRFLLSSFAEEISFQKDIRPIVKTDWPAILELDLKAFGAGRERLLRNLASRLPKVALAAERHGKLAGFVVGRDGREARQIGPLVARDAEAAFGLLNAAVAGVRPPVYMDIVDHAPSMQAWALARGFAFQRPFKRMVHGAGAGPAPGEESLVFCPAGPELG